MAFCSSISGSEIWEDKKKTPWSVQSQEIGIWSTCKHDYKCGCIVSNQIPNVTLSIKIETLIFISNM